MKNSNIEMHSAYNEEKSIIAERFIRALKNYKYMTSVSKYVYIAQLDYIVSKHNNTYDSTIQIKHIY